jgi:hypothetical protein
VVVLRDSGGRPLFCLMPISEFVNGEVPLGGGDRDGFRTRKQGAMLRANQRLRVPVQLQTPEAAVEQGRGMYIAGGQDPPSDNALPRPRLSPEPSPLLPLLPRPCSANAMLAGPANNMPPAINAPIAARTRIECGLSCLAIPGFLSVALRPATSG